MSDTLSYSKRLQEAGVPAPQAEAHARAAYEFFTGMLATKQDIANIETKLASLKGSVALVQWMAATALAVALANIGLTVAVLMRIAALLK